MNKNTVDLYYEEKGQGYPIVFLHGFPLDHGTWVPTANLLQEKVRCVLPDLRGLGKSPVVGTEATILLLAEDITRLMDKLEIPQAVFVGHSFGGYIAMQLAHSFPDRVMGLGLVATRSEPDTAEKAGDRLQSREDVLKNGTASIVKNMAARLTDDQSLLPELIRIMEKTNPQGVAMAQYAMVYRNDATPWLEKINLPVVVIAGARDEIVPEESMKNLAQRCSCGKYYVSSKATHMIPMEEPGLIARALEETFLMN
jgi:3-oxoadipate enol-lactonase